MSHPIGISFLLTLTACGGTGPTDAGPIDAGPTDAGPIDAAVDASSGLYAPAGYTVTPFLSETPVRSFTAAGDVLEPDRDYAAVLDTGAGRMVIDLTEVETPITVNSFVWLSRHRFFDGIAFHRVIEGFVVQGGDPNTLSSDRSQWGRGGPGYFFDLEIVASLGFDSAGVVGMANFSSTTNGSQFFITLAATPQLDGNYTVFARVVEGSDVLPAIARGEPPDEPTRILRAHIVERPR